MRCLAFLSALLLSACASQQKVVMTTPASASVEGYVSQPNTPAPTSANTVNQSPVRTTRLDTLARPQWLNQRIEVLANLPNRRAMLVRVYRYRFDGETVYFETPPSPDQYSTLYNQRGQVLCHPDGGLTGRGDGRCGSFQKRRTDEALVWQAAR